MNQASNRVWYDVLTIFFIQSEGEDEVTVFSAKCQNSRHTADLMESATPCHDAQVVVTNLFESRV